MYLRYYVRPHAGILTFSARNGGEGVPLQAETTKTTTTWAIFRAI